MNDETRAYLAEIGRKGGQIGGKRRLETMTAVERSRVASLAARARWGQPRPRSMPPWTKGTIFELRFVQNGVRHTMTNCIVHKLTAKKTLYWFKPEYDGPTPKTFRRMKLQAYLDGLLDKSIRVVQAREGTR